MVEFDAGGSGGFVTSEEAGSVAVGAVVCGAVGAVGSDGVEGAEGSGVLRVGAGKSCSVGAGAGAGAGVAGVGTTGVGGVTSNVTSSTSVPSTRCRMRR